MLPSHLIDQAAGVLTTAFVAGLWQGAALTLLAAALLRAMPRASAGLRHTLLLLSFTAALVLPFVRLSGGHAGAASTSHALSIASWIAGFVALLWIAAASGRAVQLLTAWRRLRTVRREATPIAVDGMDAFTAGSRRARLCTSAAVDSPTVLGFWHPALLLPEWMAPQLSSDELQQIALHECEHLRRRDDWLNLLLQLGLMLSPLNPGLVWLNRRIGVQRELACDDAVVASTGQPIAYASCLARLAEQRLQQRGRLRLALAAWERRSELAQRVHTLLQQPSRWTVKQSGMASAAAAALLLSASAGLARAPQFVRIVSAPIAAAGDAASVQVVPASRVVLAHSSSTPAAVHMMPASFPVTPAVTRKNSHARHTARRKTMLPAAMQNRIAPLPQPQMLRTSVDALGDRVITTSDFDTEAPVRLVTADFSPSYVAVPTANGWLLIQL